jgi:hypothetical protein
MNAMGHDLPNMIGVGPKPATRDPQSVLARLHGDG